MASKRISGVRAEKEREIVAFMDAYAQHKYAISGEHPSDMWNAIRNMHAQFVH